MENPLYSGQSIAVSRWVVGTVLLAVCQWVFFFFLSIVASCLGTGVILWPPPLLFFYPPPFSLKLHN